ncbi:MAG: hypothetical protein ACTHLY_21665 [Pseudolabrys sp.]
MRPLAIERTLPFRHSEETDGKRMVKPLLAIIVGAALFIALGFAGAYAAGMSGALIGMILGIVIFFLMAARYVGG